MSARKLLPQPVCDRREIRDYYDAPHEECHKGVDGRRVAAPVESAARFSSLTENNAMFIVGLQMANTRFRIIVPVQKARIIRSRCVSSSTVVTKRIKNRKQCIAYILGGFFPWCVNLVPFNRLNVHSRTPFLYLWWNNPLHS